MNEIQIRIRGEQTAFLPGETIDGAIGWNLNEGLRSIEVRLGWHTRGKGTEDREIVNQIKFDDPPTQSARPFQFVAPAQPHSFSGKLISVLWFLEVSVRPNSASARKEIVIAPGRQEILLGDAPEPPRDAG